MQDVEVLQRYESFHRLVRKACAPDPDYRFISAEEMRTQLRGVLREVVAHDGEVTAADSSLVSAHEPPGPEPENADWTTLPRLIPDSEDSSAGYLQTVIADDPEARIRQLEIGPSTPAVVIELAMACLTAGDPSRAVACGGELLEHDPWDWRGQWLQGLGHLAGGEIGRAHV